MKTRTTKSGRRIKEIFPAKMDTAMSQGLSGTLMRQGPEEIFRPLENFLEALIHMGVWCGFITRSQLMKDRARSELSSNRGAVWNVYKKWSASGGEKNAGISYNLFDTAF